MNSKKITTLALTYCSLCIVINVVFGTVVSRLQIPLIFLDTIGTIFAAAMLGPWYGATVGLLTNVITGIITNPKDIPFAIVSIAIGLIVGYIAKKWKFNLKTAIITGLILSVVAPLIGTPIAVWIYGGLTGGGTDLIFLWLARSGSDIFTAAFIPRITGNIIDKVASAVLVSLLISRLPSDIMSRIKQSREV
jgi:energy-coupling factor transport system substrate-specific component